MKAATKLIKKSMHVDEAHDSETGSLYTIPDIYEKSNKKEENKDILEETFDIMNSPRSSTSCVVVQVRNKGKNVMRTPF